jgi:hypothetical protein
MNSKCTRGSQRKTPKRKCKRNKVVEIKAEVPSTPFHFQSSPEQMEPLEPLEPLEAIEPNYPSLNPSCRKKARYNSMSDYERQNINIFEDANSF